jgi:hypothetical protein
MRQRDQGNSLLGGTLPESLGGGTRQKQVSTAETMKLSKVFGEKFGDILEKTSDTRLRKIIRAVAPLIYAQRSHMKSRCTEEELVTWDKTFTAYTNYENDDFPESVDKARKRLYEISYDAIDWTDMDTAGLEEVMRSMYAAGLKKKAQEMLDYLYESGLIPYNEMPDVEVPEEQEEVLAGLIAAMILRLSQANKFFISRAVITATQKLIAANFRETLDDDNLLSDNRINDVLMEIKSRLAGEFATRSMDVTLREATNIMRNAELEQIKKVGLRQKRWKTTSDNPCENCLLNESKGFVDIDHEYDTVEYGMKLGPLSHTNCVCDLEINGPELVELFKKNNNQIDLYGGIK